MVETETTCDEAFKRFKDGFLSWRGDLSEEDIDDLQKPLKPEDPNDVGDGAGDKGPANDPIQTE